MVREIRGKEKRNMTITIEKNKRHEERITADET